VALFAQGLVGVSARTDVVLGVRAVDDSDAGSAVLPRLGLVHRVGRASHLKVLYAEAFRSPDFFEKYVSTYDVLYGDPDLERERTQTLDVAIDTTLAERYNLQVNAFLLRTDDVIVRIPTTRPDVTGSEAAEYVNGQGDEIWGLEAALIAQPLHHLRLFASYAYADGETRQTGQELTSFANHTTSLGLSCQFGRSWALKPNAQHVSGRGAADAYTLFNLVVTFDLAPDLSLDVVARNLTDASYEYPEYIRQVVPTVPGGPERSFLLRARWVY
jgi:outer membrane receptor protein involved in Fe transport